MVPCICFSDFYCHARRHFLKQRGVPRKKQCHTSYMLHICYLLPLKKNLNHFCLDYHSVCDNVYCLLTMFSALAAVCTVYCAIEIVLITLHYIPGSGRVVMSKLHLFDLLWICCTTSCTTNPRQIHDKSKCCTTNPRQIDRLQQIHSISTCRDVVDLLYNNSESTTNPQQIEAMEFGFDLLWTCCSVAANQRADVDDVLVT